MTGNAGKFHNNVYDYNLGTVKLKIVDPSAVEVNTYTGAVKRNLVVTP